MPKSSTLTCPARVKKELSGLMSRWTIALGVRGGEHVEELVGDAEHLVLASSRPPRRSAAVLERLAVEQLGDEVERAVLGRRRRR